MRPLADPVERFGSSNPFAMAAVGLLHHAELIEAALPAATSAAGCGSPVESHELDLALLGLVSIAHRLQLLAAVDDPETATNGREPSPADVDQLDLLR